MPLRRRVRSTAPSRWKCLWPAASFLFFLFVRLTLSVEKPNPAQQLAEMIHEGVGDLGEQVIGHGYERFQAFVTCIGLFVLLNNLIGLWSVSSPAWKLRPACLKFLSASPCLLFFITTTTVSA